MSVNAVVTGIASSSASGETTTVTLTVTFSNTDVNPDVVDPQTVPVSFASNALPATINDAVTDALVDFADITYGWTLPRTRCLQMSSVRGLIV